MGRIHCFALLLALIAVSCSGSDDGEPVVEQRDDWGAVFADHDVVGTFALREVGSNTTMVS